MQSGAVGGEAAALLETHLDVTLVGVEEVPQDLGPYDVVGIASDRPYPAVAEFLDHRAWEAGVPWCEATLVAHNYRVGPVVVPGTTPCYECWSRRVASQAYDADMHGLLDLVGRRSAGGWFRGELAALNRQVAAMLAAEMVTLVSVPYSTSHGCQGWFWAGDAVYGGLNIHRFPRIGRCRRCGHPEQADLRALATVTSAWSWSH